MIKTHPIIKGTTATLLVLFGLLVIVRASDKGAPAPTQSKTETLRVVKLRLTLSDGHWANVTEFEGGTIKIERDGKKLAITPSIRDQNSGQVELRVFRVVQREGRESIEAGAILLVDKNLSKLDQNLLPLGVQVLGIEQRLSGNPSGAPVAECCARACDGTLVCGVCVCTDCGVCFTHGWCDCNPPAPPGE